MRALLLTVVLAAGCLGQYNAPSNPAPAPPKQQPSSSGPTGSPTPSPSPSPSPPQTPAPPPPNDLATAPPAPSSDGGTTSACAQLTDCCQQDQTCLDQVAGLDEAICQGILDQLQQQGYCL